MEREELTLQLKQLLDLVERGTTTLDGEVTELDARRFCDPERHRMEREVLFLRRPQVVGMSCDLKPGDFSAETVAGVPILLTRGDDGEFRAFLNACRHRGTAVVDGCGSARRFSCPWHAWTYDQRGALVGVPHEEGFSTIDKGTLGLVSLPAVDRYGLLFVVPTPGDELDVDEHLGDLGPELGSFGFEKLHRVDATHVELELNWKLANDTGFEVYHVSYLHRDSVGPLNIGNTATYRRFGYNHRMSIVATSAREAAGRPEHEWDPFEHMQFIYNVFPSTGMVVSPHLVALTRTDPGSTASTSRFRFSTYSWAPLDEPGVREMAELAFAGLLHVVQNEDYVAAARTQANLDAGSLDSILIGRNEPAVRWAHQSYDAALAEG